MKCIDDIIDSGLCIGCGLCTSIIKNGSYMCRGTDGFLYPNIRLHSYKQFELISKICPGLQCGIQRKLKNKHEKIWGPIQNAYYGFAIDRTVRWYGSSGGGITALLIYLLEKKKINAIVQTGPSVKDPFSTETYISSSKEDIIRCASSRYCPSSPLSRIDEIIKEPGIKIAFVGRPCDVTALRKYIQIDDRLKSKIVLLISFFCASTPSYFATDELLNKLGVLKKDVKEFWYRGKGWPGSATAITKCGNIHSLSYEESWGNVLSKHAHFRCKICPDGIGCSADISFADGWETVNGKPVFMESEGRNVILVRTEAGGQFLEEATREGYLRLTDLDISELEKIQPSQYEKRCIVGARLLALRCLGVFYPKCRGLSIYSNILNVHIFLILKNFFGTIKRKKNRKIISINKTGNIHG